MSNGSADSAVFEKELVCMLHLLNADVPVVKYHSIESAENSYAAGLKYNITDDKHLLWKLCYSESLKRFRITKFSE